MRIALVAALALAGAVACQEAPLARTCDRSAEAMSARFAPTEIGADVSKLSAVDRRVLAKLIEASKIIDALFLRQVWVDNESMLLNLVRDETSGRARAAALLPDQQRSLVADRWEPDLRAWGARQARRCEFLSVRRIEGGARALDAVAAGERPDAGDRILHARQAERRRRLRAGAVQRRIPERARPRGGPSARSGGRRPPSRR